MNYQMLIYKALAFAAVILAPAIAVAEDLRLIGIIEPINAKVYADRDSVRKRGAISSITLIVIPDPAVPRVDTLPFTFDCVDKTYHWAGTNPIPIETRFSWTKERVTLSLSAETIPAAFSIACKRAWEFWK